MNFSKTLVLFCGFIFLNHSAQAKKRDTTGLYILQSVESRLCQVAPLIISAESNELRQTQAQLLFSGLDTLLHMPNSYYYAFDKLKQTTVSVLNSPDERFRIFTFNSISLEGNYSHYGFLQVKEGKDILVFPLTDTTQLQPKEMNKMELDAEHWLGALYYSITPFKLNRHKMYLLIGYDGSDIHSNKKIMEILSFEKGEPVFGKDIFLEGAFDEEADTRVIFEFHNDSRMLLRYETAQKIVVADKLAPAFPEAVNDFYYYIPSGDYDYYALKKGYWVRDALENLNLGQGSKQRKPRIMPSPAADPQNKEDKEEVE